MCWIDSRLADLRVFAKDARELQARHRQISQEAENIYNALWKECLTVLDELKQKGQNNFTNGSPLHRTIRRSARITQGITIIPAEGHPGHEIQIYLSADRQSIIVSGEISRRFILDLGDDAVVCLKSDGVAICLRDAAILVLDRFFFPELHPTI